MTWSLVDKAAHPLRWLAWRRDRAALRAALATGVAQVFAKLNSDNPGDGLGGLCLCTDNDLRTVYAAVYTRDDEKIFEDNPRPYLPDSWRFFPAEWPREFSRELDAASNRLGRLADAMYKLEPGHIGPDDDHLRPWKAELFGDLVDVLADVRRRDGLGGDTFFAVASHNFNEWMYRLVADAVQRLNDAERWAQWQRVFTDDASADRDASPT